MAIINKLKPFINIGPGDIIREQMELYSWKQEDLSKILGITLKHINKLLQNKQQITLEMAGYLAKAFNTSPQYWINLDTNYRLNLRTEEDEKAQEIEIKSDIFSKMPVRELIKKGWLKEVKDFKAFLKQVLNFWDTDKLDFNSIESKFAFNFRKSEAYSQYNPWHLMCWMQMASKSASKIKVKEYDKKKLSELFNSMHEYTLKSSGVPDFLSDLNKAGVKFAILEHLQKTYLDGASFIDGKNPVIIYTARHNRLDNFWFTVAHEISHILLHLKNKDDCFIDIINKEYSGEKEKAADELASEKLYHNEILEYFGKNMDYITKRKIEDCSYIYKIHPSVVIGTLAHNKKISYGYLHLFNKDIKPMIPAKYKIEN